MEYVWELAKIWRKQFTGNVGIQTALFRSTRFTSQKGHKRVRERQNNT
jgi:hypothetical protein